MPKKKVLAPRAIGVKEIPVGELEANPHNPRMLFDRQPMHVLRDSVKKVGILVPLTVFFHSRKKRFVILDGQRRWMVAHDLGLKKVPVNEIAEPSLVQNIVTMFQIHKLREDWELMPTALKLETLMTALDERNDQKLAELTGLDRAVVARCKKLLGFPRRYQDKMLDPDPEKRVKADFFIELYAVRNDRLTNSYKWFSRDKFTDQMLEKYERKGIKAVTDFRTVKQHLTNARRAGQEKAIEKRFREFTEQRDVGIDHLALRSAEVDATARKLTVEVESLTTRIRALDASEYYGEEALWKALEKLLHVVVRILRAAERRVRE